MPLLKDLADVAFNYPAIDNHAHPLLKEDYRNKFPLEHLVSEASGNGLIEDTPHTLAFLRATKQLAPILGLEKNALWEEIKFARDQIPYLELCKILMEPCKIQCLLLDDGLGGVEEFAEGLEWHSEQFCDTRRIVRVEVEAEVGAMLRYCASNSRCASEHPQRFDQAGSKFTFLPVSIPRGR